MYPIVFAECRCNEGKVFAVANKEYIKRKMWTCGNDLLFRMLHVCALCTCVDVKCESFASQREYTHTFTIKICIYIPEWELNYTLDVFFFERGMVLIQCLCLKEWKSSFIFFVNYVK